MGISRDHWHKRRKTGGKRPQPHKKRKYELGRPAAMTKLAGPKRVHLVRTRGGNRKYRALRLETGNFSWGSESISRKTRIIDVLYNPSNNELVRTKTLTKNTIVHIDAAPFRQWYERHYNMSLGRKKQKTGTTGTNPTTGATGTTDEQAKHMSKHLQKKYELRQKKAALENAIDEQFQSGRLMACIASRPGQVGRADGYILEGKELDFYIRKVKAKKGK